MSLKWLWTKTGVSDAVSAPGLVLAVYGILLRMSRLNRIDLMNKCDSRGNKNFRLYFTNKFQCILLESLNPWTH